MKIAITTRTKRVVIDGIGKSLHDFDWSPYAAVRAVEGSTERNRFHVEYWEIDPDGDGPLPMEKPPNDIIDALEFSDRFGSIIKAWDVAPDYVEVPGEPRRVVTAAPVVDAPSIEDFNELKAGVAKLIERVRANEQIVIEKLAGG